MVMKDHKKGELGYALGLKHRGQGYATEAAAALIGYGFRVLGLHRIEAITTNVNEDSWKVMERLGMNREARLREAEHRDGEWLDTLVYGLLAREWRDLRRHLDHPNN
jgi:RimJ/RimL family protein N-acetyltransferase